MTILLLFAMTFSTVHAGVLAVSDIAMLKKLVEQYKLLEGMKSSITSQLKTAEQIKQAATGHYQLGNILSDPQQFMQSAKRWDDAINHLSAGNSERYQELLQLYQQKDGLLDEGDFSLLSNQVLGDFYDEQVAAHRASRAEATMAYDDINEYVMRIDEIAQHIEKTENNKAALDLNARLLTELAYLTTQQLKMQALINQQMATNTQLHLHETTFNAKFNDLPEGEQDALAM